MIKKRVIKAYNFSKQKHDGQKRKFSNLDYFVHPKWVARKVEELTKDEDLVIVALLHDVIEDTDTSYEEINKVFGKKIADLVYELTNDNILKVQMGKKAYMSYSINKMSSDAFTVKLVDRLHNVLFLEGDEADKNFIRWYWKETKYILEHLKRENSLINKVQLAIIHRVQAVLDFLEIRYEFK